MDQKIIFLIVLLFLLGGILGYLVGFKTSKKESLEESLFIKKLKEMEDSKLISSFCMTLEGRVRNISKDTINIENEGERLTLKLGRDLKVRKITPAAQRELVERREVSLEEVKKGAFVTIYARLETNGNLLAMNISIIERR